MVYSYTYERARVRCPEGMGRHGTWQRDVSRKGLVVSTRQKLVFPSQWETTNTIHCTRGKPREEGELSGPHDPQTRVQRRPRNSFMYIRLDVQVSGQEVGGGGGGGGRACTPLA